MVCSSSQFKHAPDIEPHRANGPAMLTQKTPPACADGVDLKEVRLAAIFPAMAPEAIAVVVAWTPIVMALPAVMTEAAMTAKSTMATKTTSPAEPATAATATNFNDV